MAIQPVPAEPVAPEFPALADKASGTYNAKAYAWGTGMPGFATGIKALADNVHHNATEAEDAASAAEMASQAAAASAATAATVAGATVWVSGTTYAQYAAVIDPTNFQTYRRRSSAGSGSTRPGLDPTNWEPLVSTLPVVPIGTNTSAAANTHYVLTANLNLTLPTSPAVGAVVRISNASGLFGSQVIPGGSDKIRGVAGARTFNSRASTDLVWSGATYGWV